MKRASLFFFSIIAAIILCVGVNVLSRPQLYNTRLDLTEDKLFTLSPETKTLLGAIEEPLHVRLFFTPTLAQGLPVFQSYYERVRNILEQYQQLTHGKITLEFVTPTPFTEEEDIAVSHGIEGVQVDNAGSKFYFGMSVENSTDDRGVVAFFDPDRAAFLEYDLTKLLTDIAKPKRSVIGLISQLPVRGGAGFNMTAGLQAPSKPWAFLTMLEEQFDVRDLNKNAEIIEDDIDILLIIHPHHLSRKLYYGIEQFLMRGGKAMIFMDSHVNLPYQEERVSEMDVLLDHFGIALKKDAVIARKEGAMYVQTMNTDSRLGAYPKITWLEMKKPSLSQESVVTEPLENIRMIEAGYFDINEKSKLAFTPLITSGNNAAALPTKEATIEDAEGSLKLYNNFVPQGKNYPLAVQFSGEMDALFTVKDLELKDKEAIQLLEKRHLSKPTAPFNIIMVSDTDMLRNEFWARVQSLFSQEMIVPEADNGAFVLNAMEFLAGDTMLAHLRTRGTQERRFLMLDDIRKSAEEQFRREEQLLKTRLKEMEERLKALQSSDKETGELFTPEQTKEIANFKELFLETRRQLRLVQRQLNRDIQALGTMLAWCNILIAPLLLLLLALFLPRSLRRRSVKRYAKVKS